MLGSGQLISMSQASTLTPYSTEYLSLLARKGKLRAVKISRDWLTTEQAITEYVERQQEKHRNMLSKFNISSQVSSVRTNEYAVNLQESKVILSQGRDKQEGRVV